MTTRRRHSPLRGSTVLMGLGTHGGGLGAAKFLAAQGAAVTVTDLADAARLSESLCELAQTPIARYRLGGHDEADFIAADAVVVNPGVRPNHPLLALARRHGAQITSEIELFLERCPARVIGVTGTTGKSTTCAMIAAMLRAAGRTTWLGGNFGGSLLGDLPRISVEDIVVLELSSFQLAHLSPGTPFPGIAVITNCAPHHLAWHGDIAAYRAAKQRLLREQPAEGVAVLNASDAEVAGWASLAGERLRALCVDRDIPPLLVPGEHNRINARCARAAVGAVAPGELAADEALATFVGLEHRLQFVAQVVGRRIINDSKSTTPCAAQAALEAIEPPVWLLAGGKDDGADFGPLAATIFQRACGAAFFGQSAARLHAAVQAQDARFNSTVVDRLHDAFAWCRRRSAPGQTIVLSPACASHDQFHDFADRGRQFQALVTALAS